MEKEEWSDSPPADMKNGDFYWVILRGRMSVAEVDHYCGKAGFWTTQSEQFCELSDVVLWGPLIQNPPEPAMV